MIRDDGTTSRRSCLVVLVAATAMLLPGCYRKVIRASGPAENQYQVEESDRDNVVLPYLEPKEKKN